MNALPWYVVAGIVAVAYSVAVAFALALVRACDLGDRWRDGAEAAGPEIGADEPADAEQEAVGRLLEWARKEAAQ